MQKSYPLYVWVFLRHIICPFYTLRHRMGRLEIFVTKLLNNCVGIIYLLQFLRKESCIIEWVRSCYVVFLLIILALNNPSGIRWDYLGNCGILLMRKFFYDRWRVDFDVSFMAADTDNCFRYTYEFHRLTSWWNSGRIRFIEPIIASKSKPIFIQTV